MFHYCGFIIAGVELSPESLIWLHISWVITYSHVSYCLSAVNCWITNDSRELTVSREKNQLNDYSTIIYGSSKCLFEYSNSYIFAAFGTLLCTCTLLLQQCSLPIVGQIILSYLYLLFVFQITSRKCLWQISLFWSWPMYIADLCFLY